MGTVHWVQPTQYNSTDPQRNIILKSLNNSYINGHIKCVLFKDYCDSHIRLKRLYIYNKSASPTMMRLKTNAQVMRDLTGI